MNQGHYKWNSKVWENSMCSVNGRNFSRYVCSAYGVETLEWELSCIYQFHLSEPDHKVSVPWMAWDNHIQALKLFCWAGWKGWKGWEKKVGKRKAKETFQWSEVVADMSLSSEDGEERRGLEMLGGEGGRNSWSVWSGWRERGKKIEWLPDFCLRWLGFINWEREYNLANSMF